MQWFSLASYWSGNSFHENSTNLFLVKQTKTFFGTIDKPILHLTHCLSSARSIWIKFLTTRSAFLYNSPKNRSLSGLMNEYVCVRVRIDFLHFLQMLRSICVLFGLGFYEWMTLFVCISYISQRRIVFGCFDEDSGNFVRFRVSICVFLCLRATSHSVRRRARVYVLCLSLNWSISSVIRLCIHCATKKSNLIGPQQSSDCVVVKLKEKSFKEFQMRQFWISRMHDSIHWKGEAKKR